MTTFHVHKGDEVLVISGSQRGRKGKVLEIITNSSRALIEGVNMIKKHVRPTQDNPKGGVMEREGELIRAEKALHALMSQAKNVMASATAWAGETSPVKKVAARAEFESAKRTWEAQMAAGNSPRALASGVTDAQIVAVDPAQQSLVLNLGSRQGARAGMPFRIVRGDQVIGNCRLLEVRELISAGMTEKLTDGIQPKVGDRVSVLAQK